jgi:hypothetical protein
MRRACLVLFLLLLVGCGNPTTPCGVFTFTGAPNGARGINLTQSFQFGPAPCTTPCTTESIVYVQIVRIIDRDTGNFLAPGPEQQARIVTGQPQATMNGWAVDRLEGRIWGFYGRNNDGTFAGTLTPGSNTAPAVLLDSPSGWPDSSWFDAVDVPICIDAQSACVNNELGYDYWLFIVGTGGNVGNPLNEVGVDWNQDAVDQAVAMWNAKAPALGKNTFPAFTRMH